MDKRYLIIDIAGADLTTQDKEILSHPNVAGVILFTRNFTDINQIKKLNKEIKQIKSPELLIMIDHEGGLIQRIKKPLTILPSAKSFGDTYEINQNQALKDSFNAGFTMAKELLDIGVDLSFAPVIDSQNQNSQVLSSRTFHHDPEVISILAEQFILGMNQAGMKATGKHYPGHGSVTEDSHLELPSSNLTLDFLERTHLKPFLNLKNKLWAFMTAHIIFPNVDSEPVTFSKYWLKELLREKYGFTGYIFSDCLNMQGAVKKYKDPKERVARSLEAGADFILLCNDRNSVIQALYP